MKTVIETLREKYTLDIVAPFSLDMVNNVLEFDCLIRGYGASKGMIVDADWKKIEPVSNLLVELGYGFSCFELNASDIANFNEVLDDWGKIGS